MKINLNNKFVWKFGSTIMLVVVFLTFNQCVVQQYNAPVSKVDSNVSHDDVTGDPVINSGTPPVGGTGEFAETGATEVARLVSDVGIKDFEQILYSMEVLTGVQASSGSPVLNLYNTLNSQLPTDNSVKNFMTSQQIAIIKLSGEFCHRLFEDASLYNSFFTNFNITQNPNQALASQNGKLSMINDFIDRFWGVNVQPQGLEDEARVEMTAMIEDLLIGENMNSTTTTRKVAKGVCTAMLSSAPVTMY